MLESRLHDTDIIVVGAGAVGLACAAGFARRGHDVLVLESGDAIGAGVSSRSSEVMHAGMYYPTGSLRHRLCVAGRESLQAYLEQRGVAFRLPGKLIVACFIDEAAAVEAIHARGVANNVGGLLLVDGSALQRVEPHLSAVMALHSANTGVFDSFGYMLALQGEIEDAGGVVALRAPVTRVEPFRDGFRVHVGGAEPTVISTRCLVNCAGLSAQSVARMIEGLSAAHIPTLTLAKGSYFSCAARSPFSHLVYPAPVHGGLGIHLTLDLAGGMRFGPDVEWISHDDPASVDYRVDPARVGLFYQAVRRYWPTLPDDALAPAYSGCRPKLSGPGEPAADFRIDGPELHGLGGLVNLFGIESPGLTSSLAIAEEVAGRLDM